MEIFFWSDYACPYCYIGETNLKAALRELGLACDLKMRSFELSPGASDSCPGPTRDLIARKYGLSSEQAESSIRRIDRMAAEAGLTVDFGSTRYTSTFDAHRLTKYAETQPGGKADELGEQLFRSGFTLCAELADHKVLLDAARAAGLEEDAVREVLDSDAFTGDVRADEQTAHEYGVSGVPYFVIDGEYAVPGALGREEWIRVLKMILDRKVG